jgi:hypothetical protein
MRIIAEPVEEPAYRKFIALGSEFSVINNLYMDLKIIPGSFLLALIGYP